LPGDCHYLEGNENAKRRVEQMQTLLGQIGLDPKRVRMFNMSSAMAVQFAEATKEMTEAITALGPNPLREDQATDD
jgi:coenzyme F420-reducing hydrogenase delta subunit